jgi:hypothetical protein
MKKLIAIAAVVVATIAAQAQGTINFANRVVGSIDAKVLGVSGAPLDGAGFMAQLYVGATASSLAAVGSPVPFRTGAAAGYVTSSTVTVNGIAGGSPASVAMRAWDASTGASYDAATVRGSSAILTIAALGGGGSPPAVPADLVGLTSFSLAGAAPGNIPEPTAVALGLLGAGALFLRRRK